MNDTVSPMVMTISDRLCFAGITPHRTVRDVATQTRDVLAQLDGLLAAAGTDRSALLTVHIWLRDMALFQDMTAEWNNWIGAQDPPSRSCVSAGALAPDALIEIVAMAAAPRPAENTPVIERYGMVRGNGRPTMCLALAYDNWFTVCTLAPDCSADIAGQARQVLTLFDDYLREAGANKPNILTIEVWLKDLRDQAVVNDVLATWLSPGQLPVGSCVRADMARPEMLIEIRITVMR